MNSNEMKLEIVDNLGNEEFSINKEYGFLHVNIIQEPQISHRSPRSLFSNLLKSARCILKGTISSSSVLR